MWHRCPLRCQNRQHGDDCSTSEWPIPCQVCLSFSPRKSGQSTESFPDTALFWLMHCATKPQSNLTGSYSAPQTCQYRQMMMDRRSVCKALETAPGNSYRKLGREKAQTKVLSTKAAIQTVYLHTDIWHWNQMPPPLLTWLSGIYSITAAKTLLFHPENEQQLSINVAY